ncbi:phosphoribosylaminoimidazolesuccinocarboxamide synthase [Melioribacteraceae bacterium 4301-Me]|uniref:phosphoribosylaminoimidazolesuccinocarboxamide synthase n=1 Tax=Pyranulibacter aquaticus TaxID=3163344 RepID=UPI003594DA09
MEQVITQTNFSDLKLYKKGKVRDIYDLGENYLMVSTDRLSAFDVIMNEGIPYKGKVLTKISKFWFDYVSDLIPNHVISTNVEDFPMECQKYSSILKDRTMLVKKSKLIEMECIVRGYISGSGWNDYKLTGSICGIKLPKGLRESEKLPEPIFTPSTKAQLGVHDENIDEQKAKSLIGSDVYNFIKEKAIAIYNRASDYADSKGIIIADTKMEFGFYNDSIILIDELLTPDSSRFWPKNEYEIGKTQNSFDKQYVRNYLLSINFNKKPPAPKLPGYVIENTSKKYLEALKILTGITLN